MSYALEHPEILRSHDYKHSNVVHHFGVHPLYYGCKCNLHQVHSISDLYFVMETVNTLKRSCIAEIKASDPRQSLLHRNKLVCGIQNLKDKSRISFSLSSASGSHLFNGSWQFISCRLPLVEHFKDRNTGKLEWWLILKQKIFFSLNTLFWHLIHVLQHHWLVYAKYCILIGG